MFDRQREVDRDLRYPLSRWYLRPLARRLADRLAPTAARPWHWSLAGAAIALASAVWIAWSGPSLVAALLVLVGWFCDRVDGPLARMQRRDSPRGAWLDATLDELTDVAWHVAAGIWLAGQGGWGWPLAVAFLSGKYLFVYGLREEASLVDAVAGSSSGPTNTSRRSAIYHLPGNADLRVHAFAVAVATGWLAPELLFFAVYYHFRWIARSVLVYRRLSSHAPQREVAPREAQAAPHLADISVALVVRDEERHLAELLPSLAWAGEVVVVVDERTTDASADVARANGCRIYERRFETFAAQRNFALDVTSRPWVLSLDADERPTPELVAELTTRLPRNEAAAYRIPIRSRILGAPFRFSGTQDDRPVRLWRRDAARWHGAVHERLHVEGAVETLESVLLHDTLPDRPALRAKIDRYTELAAGTLEARRRVVHAWTPIYAAAREFARRWIWKQGFRDGPAGLEFCWWSAYSEWVLAHKIAARQRRAVSALQRIPLGSDA